MIEKIYFQRNDGRACDILDVARILGNCSRLEQSALSPEARFEGRVEGSLAYLSYYPEFFGIKKEDFLKDILPLGYQVAEND